MKKSLKIGLLGLLMCATIFAGVLSLNTQNTEIVRADSDFTMEGGAEIRLVGTDEKEYGIKYKAKLTDYDENAEYYVMIIPTGWLTRYNLSASYDANCDYYGTLSAVEEIKDRIMTMQATPQYVEAKNCYCFEGSIKTIKYENSFREFFGIAYSEKNGVRTYAKFETGENVRSVSQVASAALNDKTAEWTDTEKGGLKKMVKTAYNASLDEDYTTQEEADIPTISAQEATLSLLGGDTHQINTLTGVSALENIGVKVKYTSNSPAQVTVSESGMLSANTVGGGATITATVLGEDYTVAKINPVENMLVGFDTQESENNIVKITSYNYLNAENQDVFVSEWQESFEGRYGVVKTVTTNSGRYRFHKVYPLFNKTVNQMQTITTDFDYISIWIYVDADGKYTARSYSHVLNEVEGKKWQEIRLTKDDIENGNVSYWKQNWPSKIWERFNGDYVTQKSDVNELFNLQAAETNAAPITVYIDSISYAKFNGDFVAPTKAGEFTLPTMQMSGNTQSPTVSVSKGTTSIAVNNGKATLPYSGDYTVAYGYTYNGLNYSREYDFSVARAAMAANMLEDFNDPASVNNVGIAKKAGESGLGNAEWLESVTIGNTTKQGVIKVTTTANDPGNLIYLRFNMTSEEL